MKINSVGWAPKYGEKKDRLFNRSPFNRPLIPCLVLFAGGILTASSIFSAGHAFGLPILLTISLCLPAALIYSGRSRAYLLLAVFFLTGALLTSEKRLPSQLRSLAIDHQEVIIEGVVLEPPKQLSPEMVRMEVSIFSMLIQ